jgi:hypothetical protein
MMQNEKKMRKKRGHMQARVQNTRRYTTQTSEETTQELFGQGQKHA